MAFMMAAMVIATLQGHAQTSDTLVVRALERHSLFSQQLSNPVDVGAREI